MPEGSHRGKLRVWSSSPTLFLVLVTVLAAGLRLFRLGDKPLWSAEIQEIFNARCAGFLSNVKDAGSDLLGFVWHNMVWRLDLTPIELWARVPGVVAGTLGVLVAWQWGKRLWGTSAALVAALMTAFSVYMVDLSQTGRWYMAAAVAGTASTIWLLAALEERDDRLRRMAPYWLVASVALLSHAMGGLFLLVHLAVISVFELKSGRAGLKRWFLQCLRAFLPLLPAVLVQGVATLTFSAKLAYHPVVFLVGQGYSTGGLLETIPAVLSGSWTPLWVLFLVVAAIGVWALWQANFKGALVWLVSFFLPLAFIGLLVTLVGTNAFDVTFLAFLFAPVFAAFGFGLAALAGWAGKRKALALTLFLVPLVIFVCSNGWLLKAYYNYPTKPVLGPDYRAVAGVLKEAGPGPEDYLFYRYGEHFTHLAFYAAHELQEVNLVAQVVPEHSRELLFEYLHRLNGCTDRPRVAPARVQQISDLADDIQPRHGRVFVVLSCPARFGDAASPRSQEAQAQPDYTLWVLEKGVKNQSCSEIIDLFPRGWGIVQFPGVILAWQPASGRTEKQLAVSIDAIFSGIPFERLRLRPPR